MQIITTTEERNGVTFNAKGDLTGVTLLGFDGVGTQFFSASGSAVAAFGGTPGVLEYFWTVTGGATLLHAGVWETTSTNTLTYPGGTANGVVTVVCRQQDYPLDTFTDTQLWSSTP